MSSILWSDEKNKAHPVKGGLCRFFFSRMIFDESAPVALPVTECTTEGDGPSGFGNIVR